MSTSTTISGMTALGAAPATGDLLPIVDISDLSEAPTGTTKKMTVANLLTAPAFTGAATGVSLALSSTLDATSTTLLGAGAWPTVTLARSGSRVGMASSTESSRLLLADMQSGVGINRGSEIYLGARGTTATADMAYALIRGERVSAASGTFTTQLLLKTSDAAGTLTTALTLDGALLATFAGAIKAAALPGSAGAVGTLWVDGSGFVKRA